MRERHRELTRNRDRDRFRIRIRIRDRIRYSPSSMNLVQRYRAVRAHTEALAAPLAPEDTVLQSMPDASPTKWHLAHTSWFFEAFVLARFDPSHRPFHDAFGFLFNSYYEGAGPRQPRASRALSRPTLAEVMAYRAHVDQRMLALFTHDPSPEARLVIELGTHHEEQHQELLLTDILHALSQNPLLPAVRAPSPRSKREASNAFVSHPAGVVEVGHDGKGFGFDNETPRHRAFLEHVSIARRLVTNGEYARFIADGGYAKADLWLSDGWALVQREGWTRPIYWLDDDGVFSLEGAQPIDPLAPVTHLSYFEADAFARWAGARLPTEVEWEVACAESERAKRERMKSADGGSGGRPRETELEEAFDTGWQWTASAYLPYPGFRPLAGTLGEYNGKFMSGQMVLRGGSSFTPAGHSRPTYRNFFAPHARWQRTAIRLAR